MRVVDVIKKGFEIANKNLNLVLVVFIFNLLWNLGVMPFTPETPTGVGPGVTMTPALTFITLIFILASVFVQGGMFGVVKDIVKEGKLELSRFAGYGAKFYFRLLCLGLIIVLIVGVIAFFATLIIAASAPTGSPGMITFTTIIALILFLIGLAIMLLLFLSPYILVVDDTAIFQAMRASVGFVKKFLGKIIGLGALLLLIGFGVGLIMGILAGILSLAITGKVLQVITGIISSGINGYLTVVVTACFITYYLAMKGGEAKETPPSV